MRFQRTVTTHIVFNRKDGHYVHILYFHQYFVPPDGTGGTRSYEFARRLVKAGHRVTLVTSSARFPGSYSLRRPAQHLEIEGIELRVLWVPYSNRLTYSRRIIAFLKFAFAASLTGVCGRDVDLIVATSTPLTIAVPAIFAKKWHRCPMVFEVRDLWPELPVAVGALKNPVLIRAAKRLERVAYRNADRVIALSPGMKEGVSRTGYPEDKIIVIPNGCDTELFHTPEAAGERFLTHHPYLKGGSLVVYGGALGFVNGVEYLVEIAAEMQKLDRTVRFIIVGDGIRNDFVRSRAQQLGVLSKNLWMIPPLPKHNMPLLLSAASIAVSLVIDMPEMWNNSANKVFDALAAGRPLMINHGGWQAELLEKYGAGIIVPPNNPNEAARILNNFLQDQDRLMKARSAATYLAKEFFSRDKLAENFRYVLEEAVDERACELANRQKRYRPSR